MFRLDKKKLFLLSSICLLGFSAFAFSSGEKDAIDKRVSKYIQENPSAVYKAMVTYQQQQEQQRAILGGKLPLGDSPFGAESLPGPDVTYTPPLQIQNPMVNLGCLSSAQITDIVPVNVTWPSSQVPSSFATGAEGPLYANVPRG